MFLLLEKLGQGQDDWSTKVGSNLGDLEASGAYRKCTIARNADAGNPVKTFPQGKAWFLPAVR